MSKPDNYGKVFIIDRLAYYEQVRREHPELDGDIGAYIKEMADCLYKHYLCEYQPAAPMHKGQCLLFD